MMIKILGVLYGPNDTYTQTVEFMLIDLWNMGTVATHMTPVESGNTKLEYTCMREPECKLCGLVDQRNPLTVAVQDLEGNILGRLTIVCCPADQLTTAGVPPNKYHSTMSLLAVASLAMRNLTSNTCQPLSIGIQVTFIPLR